MIARTSGPLKVYRRSSQGNRLRVAEALEKTVRPRWRYPRMFHRGYAERRSNHRELRLDQLVRVKRRAANHEFFGMMSRTKPPIHK